MRYKTHYEFSWCLHYLNFLDLFLTIQRKKYTCGPGSSVGIAADYGMESPGSNPGQDDIFRPYRPALGPTQPPVQWVPGLSQG